MLRSYITIALRNLTRNKVFSLINMAGLSLGLTCCMLILLYTKDEVSYDRFHANKDQLYQLTCTIQEKNGQKRTLGIAAMVQGPSFGQEIPEIEAYARVEERGLIVKQGSETFEEKALWVDDNFFTVFSFPLVKGDPENVLSDIHSLVLTEETAEKYFGSENPIGKTLELQMRDTFEPFVVTGIAKKSPQNSSIKFQMLLSFNYQTQKNPDDNWLWLSYPTYVMVSPKANLKAVEAKMAKIYAAKASKQIAEERKHGFDATFTYGLEPFTSVHLNPAIQHVREASNPVYSYILSGIALFILLIACINFVNLTVAQSLRRGKEIGIRKVVGSQRKQLIWQFLGESFLICLVAFGFALLLTQLCLPFFNEMANKRLALEYLFDYQLVVGYVALFLVTVLAAGFYPSLVLSSFNPLQTLYNRFTFSGRNYLSKSLVVIQFSLATFMIITTFFVYSQFHYLTRKELGYNDKNLVVLDVGREGDRRLMQVFQNELSQIPGVLGVAPRQSGSWGTQAKSNNHELMVELEHIDENYLPTLQIPLAAGRNFSADFPADSIQSVLVNETYVKEAGWQDSGVGKTIDFLNGNSAKKVIVGVVKDYHYGSVKEKIQPQVFTAQPDMPYGRFLLRIDAKNKPQTLAAIEKVYRSLSPYRPFQYDFAENLNHKNYETEAKWKQIVTFAAILTVFISCIGLFGLTTLSIEQRAKEIGIRKVLGASVLQISTLLSKTFLGLVFIAFLIAIPAAWYATHTWLQNFAYRIDITWWIFMLAGILALLIALVTVNFQAIKAALADPVKSLRSE